MSWVLGVVVLHARCPAWFCRCSRGVYEYEAFQVRAQYLGWPPRHLSVQSITWGCRVSPGPRGVCSSSPSQLPAVLLPLCHGRLSPLCPASPLGQGLLLSVALRSQPEGDIFNYCNHYLISSLPGSTHPSTFHSALLLTLCSDGGVPCLHRDS